MGELQVSVLAQLREVIARVPRGKVVTYGQVAAALGLSRGGRLTVWALQGSAPLPWHRVVAAGGRIALPGTQGSEQRRRLISEGVTFRRGRVCMERHGWAPSSLAQSLTGRTPPPPKSPNRPVRDRSTLPRKSAADRPSMAESATAGGRRKRS
ncbi:MAG TPA: MGMT family protein [Thermoplasmata archaeon]|nr:MGMT family protein [Thermoplasmata archaeon]